MPLQNEKKILFEHAKEEIRSRINIADVIGRHVALKAAGQSLKGLCPFHKEKTPSFIVTPSKGIFYCFGCHKGGDVFTFLMEYNKLSFSEALHLLADETGVTLETAHSHTAYFPTSDDSVNVKTSAETGQFNIPKNEMFKINETAMEFYYRQIRSHQRAIDYFLKRGLSRETIREFRLGFAPPGWNELSTFAQQQGIPLSSLVQCGLAVSKPGNKHYDRFRDRIIFPIFDNSKRPIGFGGRTLEKDVEPKYLNSPETLLYQKNKTLYGLHAAQYHIKQSKSLIIVEGYMDFLGLYQANIKNVVATSGTALTDAQARIIQRFTETVYLVFDGDSAGINAAQRAISVFAPYNLDMRVLILPDNEDPDSYIKNHGTKNFLSLLSNAQGYMDFIIRKTLSDKGNDSPQKISAVLDELLPLAESMTDSVVRQTFIKLLSESLHIDEGLIVRRYKRPDTAFQTGITLKEYDSTNEGKFMRQLLSDPSIISEARKYITPETFTDPFSAHLYSIILAEYDTNPDLQKLIDSISDPEMKRVVCLLYSKGYNEGDIHEDCHFTIARLQRKFLKSRRLRNQIRMKTELNNRTMLLKQVREDVTQLKEIETPS